MGPPIGHIQAGDDEVADIVRPVAGSDQLPVVETGHIVGQGVGVAGMRIAVQHGLGAPDRQGRPATESPLERGRVGEGREGAGLATGTQQMPRPGQAGERQRRPERAEPPGTEEPQGRRERPVPVRGVQAGQAPQTAPHLVHGQGTSRRVGMGGPQGHVLHDNHRRQSPSVNGSRIRRGVLEGQMDPRVEQPCLALERSQSHECQAVQQATLALDEHALRSLPRLVAKPHPGPAVGTVNDVTDPNPVDHHPRKVRC